MTGPALKHYRSFRVHIIETGQERKTDTVDVFPTKVVGLSRGHLQVTLDSRDLVSQLHSQLRWQLNQLLARLRSMAFVRLTFS